jgi:putative ABC transport system substrate-binding protein
MKTRRDFANALALALLGPPMLARAQTPQRLPAVGFLHTSPTARGGSSFGFLVQGLRESGFEEGKNFSFEIRNAPGQPAALNGFAAELVKLRVAVIYAIGPAAIRAALAATRVIPIVALDYETEPVKAGWARSLARPGGNLTGLFLDNISLVGKWVELLRAAAPAVRRVGLLWDSTTGPDQLVAAKAAAQGFGIETHVMELRSADGVEAALNSGSSAGVKAMVILGSPEFTRVRSTKLIDAFVVSNRLPAISPFRNLPDGGGLMSYGLIRAQFDPRAGVLIGKILNGAKPGDLAIELPSKFEFVINGKTAKALGLTMPQALLLRADEVIQ